MRPTDKKVEAFWFRKSEQTEEKVTAFWYIQPCSLVEVDVSEGWTYSIIAWWWKQYADPKRQPTSTKLLGATFQKAITFILAAVRTWNLIQTADRYTIFPICSYYAPCRNIQKALVLIRVRTALRRLILNPSVNNPSKLCRSEATQIQYKHRCIVTTSRSEAGTRV
jgi:hypothetical protein